MDLELGGKVVLITGASGGLGREMAVDFAREDARVVVHYRSGVEAAEVVAESIKNMGGEAITAQADLTDRSSVQHMLNLIKGEYGGVDVLIHGAVAFEGAGPIEQMTPETWHKMIELTLTGTFHLVNQIVPYMKQQRWGRIVNIASRTGLVGGAKLAHYSAAKAGLIGMTKALAKELGPSGILVNAIAPTTILTPKERERMTPERQEKLVAQIPLGRIATPDDISHVALFLGSGMNTFVNGEVITVGGGAQT
ncbi:MAG TPA: SDR family NAD(P)-dependent oxidoreductase [Anaerolineae bacterium]|nr:SDR family NAD(P)-dependent oxidoreductase [Anaerolineae bacterium]